MATTQSTSLFHSTDQIYWKSYLEARPKYSKDLFKRLLDHHSTHCHTRELAIDIGGGAGQATEALADHFDKVVLNDVNAEHVLVARSRLQYLGERISFLICEGETIDAHMRASTADFVLVAECIPLMDASSALPAWHKVLRPGGTLAILFYGRPLFTNADGPGLDKACNTAYANLINKVYGDITSTALTKEPDLKQLFQRSWDMQNSRLDNVQLSSGLWQDVHRTFWNCDDHVDFAMYDLDGCGIQRNYFSNVSCHEQVERIQDRSMWAEEWGISEVKRYLSFLIPGVDSAILGHESDYVRLLDELEQALGGAGKKRMVTWPIVLILATKKKQE